MQYYVGLIVNELVTNAYKYAFNEEGRSIYLTLTQENKHFQPLVEDDGSGFDTKTQKKSLGSKLIIALVLEQLQGSMLVESVTKLNIPSLLK